MRDTPVQAGGGRDRASMVAQARQAIEEGSQSFAAASKLFDQKTRERAWLLYAWCRRCDDIADNQDKGGPLAGEVIQYLDALHPSLRQSTSFGGSLWQRGRLPPATDVPNLETIPEGDIVLLAAAQARKAEAEATKVGFPLVSMVFWSA